MMLCFYRLTYRMPVLSVIGIQHNHRPFMSYGFVHVFEDCDALQFMHRSTNGRRECSASRSRPPTPAADADFRPCPASEALQREEEQLRVQQLRAVLIIYWYCFLTS